MTDVSSSHLARCGRPSRKQRASDERAPARPNCERRRVRREREAGGGARPSTRLVHCELAPLPLQCKCAHEHARTALISSHTHARAHTQTRAHTTPLTHPHTRARAHAPAPAPQNCYRLPFERAAREESARSMLSLHLRCRTSRATNRRTTAPAHPQTRLPVACTCTRPRRRPRCPNTSHIHRSRSLVHDAGPRTPASQ